MKYLKYVVGGLAIAIVTGLLVLVIRQEANGLHQSISRAEEEHVDHAIDRAPEAAARAAGRVVGRVIGPVVSSGPPAAATNEKSSEKQTPSGEPPPSAESTANKVPPKAIDPVDVVGGLFETGRRVVKAADDFGQEALQLDDKQAREIGAEVHRLILRDHKVLVLPAQSDRVRLLAEPVLAHCKRKTVNYTFTLLDDATVNAFSHVGGYVYVHRGLLDLVRSDAELQFVLAHEIGHVDLRHCERGLNYTAPVGQTTHELVGHLAQAAYHLIALGYSEDLEFEADEYAFRDLIRIGRSRDEALAFPRRFLKYAREKGLEAGNKKPSSVPGAVVQEVENHFRSHPPAADRLNRLEAIKL